jgi:ATP-dependent exoDNAse (exonuclease V) beta subunit
VPILLEVAGTVLRGSIDLLVEAGERPPLIVDFKTDRLAGHAPRDLYERYGIQRDIYALAVGEATGTAEVEVAYVFLERPEEPVIERLGAGEMGAGRARLEAAIGRVRQAA